MGNSQPMSGENGTTEQQESGKPNDGTMAIDTNEKSGDVPPTKHHKYGKIQGGQSEMLLAALVLIIPMLVLTVVLIGLVLTHLMPKIGSTYSVAEKIGLPLGSAYYVNYSATRLVFISSVSSTLAPFLISAAMYLYSYPLALSFTRSSDKEVVAKLPSPYQLDLIIQAIDARLKSLWSMLLYICTSKRKRVPVIPDLWKGFGMLTSLAILA